MRLRVFPSFLLAIGPAVAVASPAPQNAPVAVYDPAPIEPARLEEGRRLAVLLWPDSLQSVLAKKYAFVASQRVVALAKANPAFASSFRDQRALPSVQRLIDRSNAQAESDWKVLWPDWRNAHAQAYARRLTVDQMKATQAFATTPEGRAFVEAAADMQNDSQINALSGAALMQIERRVPIEATRFEADLKKALN